MCVAFANANAKATHFFSKNIRIYAIFNDQSFNYTLTNDIVSFEQFGPDLNKWGKTESLTLNQCNITFHHKDFHFWSAFSISFHFIVSTLRYCVVLKWGMVHHACVVKYSHNFGYYWFKQRKTTHTHTQKKEKKKKAKTQNMQQDFTDIEIVLT